MELSRTWQISRRPNDPPPSRSLRPIFEAVRNVPVQFFVLLAKSLQGSEQSRILPYHQGSFRAFVTDNFVILSFCFSPWWILSKCTRPLLRLLKRMRPQLNGETCLYWVVVLTKTLFLYYTGCSQSTLTYYFHVFLKVSSNWMILTWF